MPTALIAIIFCVAFAAVALVANARLRGEARLPMQWWLNGEVTWTAPRGLALAFVPVLGALMFAGLTILSLTVPPRPGQEHLVIPAAIAIGILLLASQLFHLWMIERTLRRDTR